MLKRRLSNCLTAALACGALLSNASGAWAQGVASGLSSSAPATPTQRLSQALSAIGMTSCANMTLRVADFLFEGSPANFTVQPLGPDGNAWPTIITIEGAYPANGRTRMSTILMSPGCSGFYQQVIYWPEPCDQLKGTTFSSFTNEQLLLDTVRVSELGVAMQLYLMPAGTGCVSTKKEMFR